MIQVEGLTKLYGEFVAVNELSFAVQPGQVLGLVGPNGAGKTTTLRCLAGILPPNAGTIRISGFDLASQPVEARGPLAFTARLYGVGEDAATRARDLLDELELAGKERALPSELSRGMKQKLVVA